MIETARLILRGWRGSDRAPFHAMGNDPRVMEHLGPPLTHADVDAVVARQNALLAATGHCFWAIERRDDAVFLGFCGLKPGPEATPIAGKVEIGWRLAHEHWGQGYAREAARASLDWGFANLPDDAIWAITTPGNMRSQALMERLGMTRRHDMDFDHPNAPEALRRHVTFQAERPA